MATIQMDPPHAVDTGAACSCCLGLSTDALQRCAACKHAWYHNRECQQKHYKQHKRFCKVMKLFDHLNSDLPESARPSTATQYYTQRINARQAMEPMMGRLAMEPMMGRPLEMREARAIMCEAKCSVCMRTRDQLAATGSKLSCCEKCHWGWVCTEHEAEYHTEDKHGKACSQFKLMNDAQIQVSEMLAKTGRMPTYLPETQRLQPTLVPEDGWSSYSATRPLVPRLNPTTTTATDITIACFLLEHAGWVE
eukprot:gene22277-29352_t